MGWKCETDFKFCLLGWQVPSLQKWGGGARKRGEKRRWGDEGKGREGKGREMRVVRYNTEVLIRKTETTPSIYIRGNLIHKTGRVGWWRSWKVKVIPRLATVKRQSTIQSWRDRKKWFIVTKPQEQQKLEYDLPGRIWSCEVPSLVWDTPGTKMGRGVLSCWCSILPLKLILGEQSWKPDDTEPGIHSLWCQLPCNTEKCVRQKLVPEEYIWPLSHSR